MSGAWLQPMPSRKRSPCVLVKEAYPAATSDGSCIQRFRMPVAITTCFVDASRLSTQSRTGPPTSGIHSAEAELFQLRGGVCCLVGVPVPQLGTPDSDARQIHAVVLSADRQPH